MTGKTSQDEHEDGADEAQPDDRWVASAQIFADDRQLTLRVVEGGPVFC